MFPKRKPGSKVPPSVAKNLKRKGPPMPIGNKGRAPNPMPQMPPGTLQQAAQAPRPSFRPPMQGY